MHRLILITVLSLAVQTWADDTTTAIEPQSRCVHTDDSFNCVKFHHNYDGDTLTVNIPQVHPLIGSQITVRVEGVDSPEMKSADVCEREMAKKAQQEAERLLEGATRVDLRHIQRDKYFRVLAEVVIDGRSLAQHLIDKRLAVSYDGGHKDKVDWCKRAVE